MELIFKGRLLFLFSCDEFFHNKSGKKFCEDFPKNLLPHPMCSVEERGHHPAEPRGRSQQPPVAKAAWPPGILLLGLRISEEVKGRT